MRRQLGRQQGQDTRRRAHQSPIKKNKPHLESSTMMLYITIYKSYESCESLNQPESELGFRITGFIASLAFTEILIASIDSLSTSRRPRRLTITALSTSSPYSRRSIAPPPVIRPLATLAPRYKTFVYNLCRVRRAVTRCLAV